MAISTANWLYIGNFSEMDTDESNISNENDNIVLGTYQANDMQIVNVSGDDADNDGILSSDDSGAAAENLTYDVGAGPVVSALDAEAIYNATLVTDEGTVSTTVIVAQTQNGDVFVLSNELNNTTIHSVQLTSFDSDNYFGLFAPIATEGDIQNSTLVCFCSGTLIDTPDGPVPVERLNVDDLVLTQDRGAQPIRWIGRRHLDAVEIAACEKHRPIRISRGALGCGLPIRDLWVSRQHRMLVRSRIAERMFGQTEVLVPAIALTELPSIDIDPEIRAVSYYHLFCDTHEIVWANGAPSESLFPGPQARKSSMMRELLDLFPALGDTPSGLARPLPAPRAKMLNLVRRHHKNQRALLMEA